MSNQYAAQYIKQALTQKVISPPEPNNSNGQTDILVSLYQAHQSGGIKGARAAWELIKTMRPDSAVLEHYQESMIHADELKNLAKPSYMMEEYPILEKGFNALIGPSGSCKSFTALDIAARLSLRASIVYNAGEGLSGYASRWEAWKYHHHQHSGQLHFYTEGVQVIDDISRAAFIEECRPLKPLLVIIDTMARAAVGIEENSAKEIGQLVAGCYLIMSELDCGILMVHHTGKDGKYRGSSAFFGACDSIIAQSKLDGLIYLYNDDEHGGKNKHFEAAAMRRLKLLPVNTGEFQSAVLMDATDVIEAPDVNQSLTDTQRAILEAIDGYDNGMSVTNVIDATNISRATVFRQLKVLVKSGFLTRNDKELYLITEDGQDALLW